MTPMASMQDGPTQFMLEQRFGAIVVGAFSGVALLIDTRRFEWASYLVASRTFEIGARMAIGATRLVVFEDELGQSITLALAGIM